MLPELSRRYGIRPADLDDMTQGEVQVYVDHMNTVIEAEQAERRRLEEQQRQLEQQRQQHR